MTAASDVSVGSGEMEPTDEVSPSDEAVTPSDTDLNPMGADVVIGLNVLILALAFGAAAFTEYAGVN